MTKAANNSGNIRLRADGRWEARYTAPDGSRRSLFSKTQAEARQKLTRTLAAIDDGTYSKPTQMTVNKWLDIWLLDYLNDTKPRTQELYKNTVDRFIRPKFGKMKLTALNTASIQTYLNKLLREGLPSDKPGKGGKGVSPKTVKNIHGVLHRALNDAVSVGYLRVNPSTGIKLPRLEKPELHPFDEDQIGAFLDAIQGHDLQNLFYVTLFCGLRQGEVLELT